MSQPAETIRADAESLIWKLTMSRNAHAAVIDFACHQIHAFARRVKDRADADTQPDAYRRAVQAELDALPTPEIVA